MHNADIVMITNFFRVLILLIAPIFIVDIIEFFIIFTRKWKNNKKMEKFSKK